MKANIPKAYVHLPKPQQDAIMEWQKDEITRNVTNIVNHEEAELQKVWICLACILLRQAFGFGKKRLMQFIVGWKRIYRKNKTFETKEDVKAYIEKELNCFDGDFPWYFIDHLEDI